MKSLKSKDTFKKNSFEKNAKTIYYACKVAITLKLGEMLVEPSESHHNVKFW